MWSKFRPLRGLSRPSGAVLERRVCGIVRAHCADCGLLRRPTRKSSLARHVVAPLSTVPGGASGCRQQTATSGGLGAVKGLLGPHTSDSG